jgi:hypothetical protein
MSQRHLVLFDADHIKEYVFATGRLKEIRGASEIVRRLTDEDALLKHPGLTTYGLSKWSGPGVAQIIYAAGGAGAIVFADGTQAEAFCRKLENMYASETLSATLTAVAVPIDDTTPAAEVDAQHRAARALARRKASKPQILALPGGGLIRFGASDRLHPAEVKIADPDENILLLSEETARKRLMSYQLRSAVNRGSFWDSFLDALPVEQRDAWKGRPHESQDLNSIGDLSRPSGYVAFLHLDGDSIGSTLRHVVQVGGFDHYHRFSQALADAARNATVRALADVYQRFIPRIASKSRRGKSDADQRIELPFELITIGGDDVLLICTAEHGLSIAQTISTSFGTLVSEYLSKYGVTLPKPVSASVGVVIAHASMPIVQLQERAYDLLKNAKRRRDPQRDAGQGFLDFQVVTTPALDRIALIREQGYQGGDGAAFTRRPYRNDQAKLLIDHARTLSKMPEFSRSKRADLYTACATNRIQATLDVLTVSLRLRAAERSALIAALSALNSADYFPFTYEYVGRDRVYRTALLDLLEVMEFIPREAA